MESKTVYEVSKDDMVEAIKEVLTTLIEENIYGKFHNVIIDTATCCQILGINSATLTAYLKETPPRVPSINSEKGKHHKFDLAEVLKVYQYIKDTKSKTVANLRFKRIK